MGLSVETLVLAKKYTDEQIKNSGESVDLSALKEYIDLPFEESFSDTLTLDGDSTGLILYSSYYKVLDIEITEEDLIKGGSYSLFYPSNETIQEWTFTENDITPYLENSSILSIKGGTIIVVIEDNNFLGVNFTKGIYIDKLFYGETALTSYVISLTINGFNKFSSRVLKDSYLPDVPSPIQPDWNQNDESAPDYIKNRPFYSTGEYVETELLKDAQTMYIGKFHILREAPPLQIGHTYKVIFNEEEYVCVAEMDKDGYIGVGDISYPNTGEWSDSKEPFYLSVLSSMGFVNFKDSSITSGVFSIYELEEIVQQIDLKYLEKHIVGRKSINQQCIYENETYTSEFGAEVFNSDDNVAVGMYSHAEGRGSTAIGRDSHAEGSSGVAFGSSSHVGGSLSEAIGNNSFAHGESCIATGHRSWAQNSHTEAFGHDSHAEGSRTVANTESLHVQGSYNIYEERDKYYIASYYMSSSSYPFYSGETVVYLLEEEPVLDGDNGTLTSGNTSSILYKDLQPESCFLFNDTPNTTIEGYQKTHKLLGTKEGENNDILYQWEYSTHEAELNQTKGKYLHIVGNGGPTQRSNAHTLDWDGNAWYSGDVYVGSTSGVNRDEGSKKLATEDFVNEQVNNLIIVSEEEPEGGTLWIDKDANEEIILAEIDDNAIDTEKTWSSSKINEEVTELNEKYIDIVDENIGYTITWDGNIEGRDAVQFSDYVWLYHVSDIVPTMEDFMNGYSVTGNAGDTINIPTNEGNTEVDGMIQNDEGNFIIVTEACANTQFNGVQLGKAGIYLAKSGDVYVSSLTINGLVTRKFKESYLPEHSHDISWNDVTNKPFEIVGNDTLTWDGNTEGLESVDISSNGEMVFCHISNIVLSQSDISNGCSVIFTDGSNSNTDEYTSDDCQFLEDGFGMIGQADVYIVPQDNYSVTGLIFPKKGLYVQKMTSSAGVQWVSSITINGYTGFQTEKIKESYLPESIQQDITELNENLANKNFAELHDISFEENMIDLSCIVDGFINENGNYQYQPEWQMIEKNIPVKPNTKYYRLVNSVYEQIVLYDDNNNFIGVINLFADNGTGKDGYFETPENCYFIRFQATKVGCDYTTQVYSQIRPTKYVESNTIAKITIPYNVYSENVKEPVTNDVVCWGDSLTEGANGATPYTTKLAELLGSNYTVINRGKGGDTAEGIACRQGGLPIYLQPCSLSNTAHEAVNVVFKNIIDESVKPMFDSSYNGQRVNINGKSYYTSLRGENRQPVLCAYTDGEGQTINRPYYLHFGEYDTLRNKTMVIWSGSNNAPNEETIESVIQKIRAMIAHNGNNNYIVIGLTSLTAMPDVLKCNRKMALAFGVHFLDISNYLRNYALNDLGISETSQDVIDKNNGDIPSSLRTDSVHLTSGANEVVANQVYKKGKELGYW